MSEHDEQVAVVEWCDLNGIPVFAIPNGGMHMAPRPLRRCISTQPHPSRWARQANPEV